MNNPCEDLSYEAKIHLSFEIDGLNFTSDVRYTFDVSPFPKLSREELEESAKMLFTEEFVDIIADLDIDIEIESIRKI